MDKNANLTIAEEKLAELIWREEPLSSPTLVALAENELAWKKSTTYTVLKKLCNKGIFKNENATVSAMLTQDDLIAQQSRQYIENTFGGSLPQFIAAFMGNSKLSPKQAAEIRQLIEQYEGDDANG